LPDFLYVINPVYHVRIEGRLRWEREARSL
jgi:hypothetical protein